MIERASPAGAPDRPPRHVAIVMDGNRRWAEARNLATLEGHRAGARRLREIVRAASGFGIEVLTVFAFSEENWGRSAPEVAGIMDLLRAFAVRECEALVRQNVRVGTLGRLEALPPATRDALQALCAATAGCTGLLLNLAVNYGSRAELCDAIQALARDVKAGKLRAEDIDDGSLAPYLYTAGLPDPDLLIRTGGELRLSNFLLYQLAYTELWATPVQWPDFDEELFARALGSFAARQRRFGT
jgi:undecaprenyl diphosphate synthase